MCPSIKFSRTCLLICMVLLHINLLNANSVDDLLDVKVDVNVNKVLHEVDERFVSVAFDSSLIITHWTKVNFTSRKFCTLLSGLSPVHLRVGGSSSNFLIFSEHGCQAHHGIKTTNGNQELFYNSVANQKESYYLSDDGRISDDCHDDFVGNFSEFCMTGEDFDAVNKFVHDCGDVRMLFVFNVLLRKNRSLLLKNRSERSLDLLFADHGISGRLAKPQHSGISFSTMERSKHGGRGFVNRWKNTEKSDSYIQNDEGVWNSTNAEELLKYIIKKNYSSWIDFELGNEPSSFPHAFNRTLSAEQLAKDYTELKRLVGTSKISGTRGPFSNSIITGPAVTQPKKESLNYLKKFLRGGAADIIDAITVHHYYTNGRNATLDDMLSVVLLDTLKPELDKLWLSIRSVNHSIKLPVWLGETASCYGGGAPGLSDRYAAGFMWMDKLGVAASNNVSVVIRQSFRGSCYQLIDKNIHPNPDYWLTWLYRRLVGQRVFKVKVKPVEFRIKSNNTSVHAAANVRLYAHCANNKYEGYKYKPGAMTLYGMNVGKVPVNLTLPHKWMTSSKHVYWILPHGKDGLVSSEVEIGGEVIKMLNDTTFIRIKPEIISADKPVTLPATSFGFIVIPNANVSACKT